MVRLLDTNRRTQYCIKTAIGFLLIVYAQLSGAVVKIMSPEVAYQGKSQRFEFVLTDAVVASGEFYYRVSGAAYFQRLPVVVTGRNTAVIRLPASAVVSPGIEYYVSLTDTTGRVRSSPYNPPASFHYLEVNESAGRPEFRLLSPQPGQEVTGDSLEIGIEVSNAESALSPENTLLLLDDTDITSLAEFDSGLIRFSTSLVPASGEHRIKVVVLDSADEQHEKNWIFEVGSEAIAAKKNEYYLQGGLSFNYGNQIRSASTASSTASANMNLTAGVSGEDWDLRLNGINLQYIKDAPENDLTISSGFTITYTQGEQIAEFGDITISETGLVAPSFSRRGLQAKLRFLDSEFRVFQVGAETVTGWESGLGDSSQRVFGFSVNRFLMANDQLPVRLTYIKGENSTPAGANSNGVTAPVKGEVVGMQLDHTIDGVTVKAEIASSNFDADTDDSQQALRDNAATIQVSTAFDQLSLGANYHYYGTDYASIANPNFTADRKGFDLNAGATLGLSNIALSLTREQDNVSNDNTRPVVNSTVTSASYGIAAAPWPSLNLTYSHSVQDSANVPAGVQAVANTNDVFSLALAKSGEQWGVSLNTNFSKLQDDIGNLDSDTRSASLALRYTPPEGLGHDLSLTQTESISGGVEKRTRIAALTTSGLAESFWGMNVSMQASYTINDASDNSQDASILNATLRLSKDINKYVKRWLASEAGEISLSANYSRTDDSVTPANTGSDLSVFVSINIFTPIGN